MRLHGLLFRQALMQRLDSSPRLKVSLGAGLVADPAGAIELDGGLRSWFANNATETQLYLRLVVEIFSVLKRYQEAEEKVVDRTRNTTDPSYYLSSTFAFPLSTWSK